MKTDSPEIKAAFLSNEHIVRIQNYKVSCILALIFMPAGAALDYVVYPKLTPQFLILRLACSALLLFMWWLVQTKVGYGYYRALGLLLPAVPCVFISWMIFDTNGCNSSYYAGLNLILLGAALLLRWNFTESLFVFFEVLGMYIAVCLLHHFFRDPISRDDFRIFFNNIYFLFVTGVFVAIGSLFSDRLRFREFALRFELDENKKQLEENNQKLREMDEAKSRFFANISHELRTPLTLLLAPLETLLHRSKLGLDEETRNVLLTMQSNGMRLLKLINDLLDLVRLESGVMQVKAEALDLADFVKGLASAARQVADDKRIALETEVDSGIGLVLADRDKLEKIILNLQFNALKFTPSGGKVVIHAEKQEQELVLQVKDTGMGISAKNLNNVFNRFWQGDDSSRRKFQGVGIGLALVKELTEVMGGKASVESVEGKGTTFTIRLPFEAAPAGAVSKSSEAAAVPGSNGNTGSVTSEEWLSNLYRRAELFPSIPAVQERLRPGETIQQAKLPKVLVADDEPDMLRFLKTQLSRQYQIIEAVDGQQAVDKSGQFLPDIIILDMMMPEKDGLQACGEIRERTSTQSIPIILLTARADEETKLAALKAGASDFLSKPFSTTELHVRIKNLVESNQYQIKLSKQNQVLENTIEQLKETETQLVQTEKLASLGRLSAGIIHEINNPLNFATTGLYTLRNKGKFLAPEAQEEYQEVLRDVEDGIKRVRNIVSDLRTFTHPDMEGRDQVETVEVVNSALRFLSHEWKDKVQLEKNLDSKQKVLANKSKLIQVVVNLLQNSLDALKEKSFENGEKPSIWIETHLEGGSNILKVRDNGPGVSQEHLSKIFDPFFTTKDVGQGMGLGLSICYRIIQECGGNITVRTEPGKYCEFNLEFPVKG